MRVIVGAIVLANVDNRHTVVERASHEFQDIRRSNIKAVEVEMPKMSEPQIRGGGHQEKVCGKLLVG
jgi:hypothetical protein